ncbi:UNVERIFIED_CONTAM: Copper transporter 5.1 [Sesamum angustifolium]|uniref:Copper transport protein n=1 Tax=Sesamum angustifolium TaxID=2727405 RepID=A0AAW2N608_9LAMI
MMHTTLHWSNQVTLLFDSWNTKSWPSYALALLICFLVALFYQRLEALRLRLRLRLKSAASPANPSPPSLSTPLIVRKLGRNWKIRLGLAALFGLNSGIGYLIMLAIMSYNGGVLLAVVLGMTVGYFVFRSEDFSDGDDSFVAAETNSTCACS